MDNMDKKIISLLKKNAKYSIKELSYLTELSSTPIFERIKRLEKLKIIKGYTVLIDAKKCGKNIAAFCNVSLTSHTYEMLCTFEEKITQLEEVLSCYHIAGSYDYLLKIEVKDMEEYAIFIKEKLTKIPHIGTVQSSFIMKKILENG
ncbi:MAG: Lrp/AsnC family transcriptional regulator [Flavobacteriia bacterium]|nr:Lrp/AsnC family transcriptional regulator [Flavobacteriia bacterium]